MRLLLVARMDGWLRFYADQLVQGFRRAGAECRALDYRAAPPGGPALKLLGRRAYERRVREHRTGLAAEAARAWRADVILTNRERLDFADLRERSGARVVFWDWDGPGGALAREDFPWEAGIDLVCTVSRALERRFAASRKAPVRYLPHGVDADFFAPGPVTDAERGRFGAPIAFDGRADARRAEMLAPLAGAGLALWGDRWSRREYGALAKCVREEADLLGADLAAMYRATTVVVSVLRAPFAAMRSTILTRNFFAPASGACLLAEWVEELGDAFDVGGEVLAFRTPEDLVEQALRFSRDRAAAGRIGAAGRRRCEAEHTLAHRARALLAMLRET